MAPKVSGHKALQASSGNTGRAGAMPNNANGKRKIEVIDLVDSDNEFANPSRKIPRANNTPGSYTQAERDTWVISDDDEADELILNGREDDGFDNGFDLYGTLQTKIVGVRFYHGYATIGEHVLIRREPSNQYDRNAIRIDNVQREQIGHIPRQVAAKLARYLDNGSLVLSGTISGRKGEFDCPIAVELYGPSEAGAKAQLKREMEMDRLPVDELNRQEAAEKKRKAAELKNVAKQGAGVAPAAGSSQQWGNGTSQVNLAGSSSQGMADASQSIETIMLESERFNPREMGQAVEKYGAQEESLAQMPMADIPSRLSTSLLPYQRQGLAWLLDRENPKLPAPGSLDVVQLWKRSPNNPALFTNIATNYSTKEKPVLASGGILADDMGLGKTLEMIALMVADMDSSAYAQALSQSRATLIIAPVSVMSNWSGQVSTSVLQYTVTQSLTTNYRLHTTS